ncbi:leucine carboxyl methyltransferase [Laetiporus sulphureus 93-53]|uniref:Leucine carboxyl methyltransferase 1 n=1 Tax=Laetiporus sulphureus 93-53 TaxID=1314785 RepID=A0A165BQ11_9APHY|nr:leucine carboxyl methyltransferase [Laetiporus sulphureus 93-53]KZT01447.1 leucine carboxyl methyltransferase [Laetiporus sulphureus 93-53]
MLPPAFNREESAQPDPDAAIRLTDTDAALARLSAVQKHYLSDPFTRYFAPRAYLQPSRPPLINIGTYVRSEALDKLVNQWLELSEQQGLPCQIVSLGAGSDTRFWRITTGPRKSWLKAYFELDFPEVTTKKAMAIRKSRDLSAVLGKPEDITVANGGTALHAPTYHLLPADLRRPPSETLAPLASLLSPSHPTLLLFECVLVYMTPTASSALLQWFVDHFAGANAAALGGLVYEMYGLEDSFGRVMRANLQARNVVLPGAHPYPTLQSLPNRFLQHGFTTANALTLREIRRSYIDPTEQERISHLEMLDEIEELELVLEHYAITWGLKVPPTSNAKVDWTEWRLQQSH